MKGVFLGMIVSLLVAATAQAQPVEVDQAEVLRMGDLVQHVDGIGSDHADRFVEVMGPPASDADKWFISVLSMEGCGACQKLKSDWAANQWLLALANPSDPKSSWAHFNVYQREDRSQAFRFENIKVTAYPTILVQPPRSGRYGEPKAVVFQGTYGGDPERLARQITTAIRLYVAKFESSKPPRQLNSPILSGIQQGSIGVNPPWQPVPKVDPQLPNVTPVFPDGRPLLPPNLEPSHVPQQPTSGWGTASTVAGASAITLLLAFGIPWGLRKFREVRTSRGQKTLLTDAQFEALLTALSALSVLPNSLSEQKAPSAASSEK